eukprot:Polyplicarium_translucidae@DN3284_c0_g2_i4.p1
MIGTVARASKDGQASPCAVIVDGQSLCVLSACCKAYDIIEKGATVVEGLMKRRQPLPDVDAIYFVSATAESVEAITKDFHGDKAQHKKVHIFLSGPLNNESGILEILTKSSSLLPRLRSLVEFNLNFIAYESRIFHLNRPDSLAEVYEGEEGSNMATLGAIADQLLTLCATFKDIPNIRFQTGASRFTEQIASLLHAKLKRLDWLGTRGRTTLVIIDRSIDCAPLFLHEYTYQAVAYDLLGISCASTLEEVEAQQGDDAHADDTYQYEFTSNQGKLERKVALLNESDEVWHFNERDALCVRSGASAGGRRLPRRLHHPDAPSSHSTTETKAEPQQLLAVSYTAFVQSMYGIIHFQKQAAIAHLPYHTPHAPGSQGCTAPSSTCCRNQGARTISDTELLSAGSTRRSRDNTSLSDSERE